MAPNLGDWRTIAEQASKEMDPNKLAALVEQLCCALNERDKRRREINESATVVKSTLPTDSALSRSSLPIPPASQAGSESLSSL
jgi:hypothetical protein